MRILVSCQQSLKRHPIPAYDFWRQYFVRGMEEAGHEVLEVPGIDWAEGLTYPAGPQWNAWLARTWEAVDRFARQPIDLFLGYLFPKQVDPAAVAELQRRGIPCVNFFCDNVRDLVRVPEEYKPFALHWVPEFDALKMYRYAGLPHLHAPMPCWVDPSLRTPPEHEIEPATFTGSADILRRDLLGRALELGADFVVRGHGWRAEAAHTPNPPRQVGSMLRNQVALVREYGAGALVAKVDTWARPLSLPEIPEARTGDLLSPEEYIRVCREAKVAIGVNRVTNATHTPQRPLVYSRLRDLEVPMMGACYLTEWAPGLETMYELGPEIETYRTAEELTDKLAELLKSPARRNAMRERAQRRALSEHSVSQTIRRIAAHLHL